MKTLQDQISEMQKSMMGKISAELMQTLQKATSALAATGIEDRAIKVGDSLPSFTLPNANGKTISSDDLLANGSLVINFYRGSWCPYCNLELAALQKILPQIEATGASLIAISPELPDQSISSVEKHNLKFEVLSDVGNILAKKLGLSFDLAAEIRPIYLQMGLDIPARNGDTSWTIPIPATYVIDRDGKIIYSFLQSDYTRRAEPADVLDILKS